MMECPESRDQQQQHMTPWARGIRIKNKLLISVDDIFLFRLFKRGDANVSTHFYFSKKIYKNHRFYIKFIKKNDT